MTRPIAIYTCGASRPVLLKLFEHKNVWWMIDYDEDFVRLSLVRLHVEVRQHFQVYRGIVGVMLLSVVESRSLIYSPKPFSSLFKFYSSFI